MDDRRRTAPNRRTSCGVLVTDGPRLLLGHASRTPRWDIPKGGMEAGETAVEAALRELREETGLVVPACELVPLGRHVYLKEKDLVLFAWLTAEMPDPLTLRCTSMVPLADGGAIPELDRFGLFEWRRAAFLVGKNMARLLLEVRKLVPESL